MNIIKNVEMHKTYSYNSLHGNAEHFLFRDGTTSYGIQKTVAKGIDFLAEGQEKNGSFFCLVSTKIDDYENADTVPAIVPTNIVLSSLVHIPGDIAKKIKQKAAKFLLGEKGQYWSFNYWFRKSDWYKREPYPDDTDDTFCALAALAEYKPELFDGETMARIVTMLTSAEEKEGGPYDMWLVPPKARKKWRDIDLVCNSNIAYFLYLQDISLPKLDAYIDKSIDERDYEFPYNKIYPGIYFISRFYKGKKKKQMTDLLLKKQEADGKWENPLRTALAISSLINFEGLRRRKQLEKGIAYLIRTQGNNGGWEPYSFYYQMRTKKKTLFAGSPFITTALCLEAIHKFEKFFIKSKPPEKFQPEGQQKEKEIYEKVIKSYRQRFSEFPDDFQERAFAVADKMLKKNKDIVLLPHYFRYALEARGNKIKDGFIFELGLANLFGWVAYTIYDDFLDEEGDPIELSLANVCLRESAAIFTSVLPPKTGFADYSKKIFDAIDSANMWEVSNCRDVSVIPDYGDFSQLADKSLGHALGPAAIIFALGFRENSKELKNTMRFFKNYIIARQLNDDAHDWEDDLKRGHVNAVGARLLRDAKGESKKIEKLRELFWHKTVVGACQDISKHAYRAKKNLNEHALIKRPQIFMEMLASIERSVEKALREREETIKFLKTYRPR